MAGVTLVVALLASAAVLVAPRRYALPIFFGAFAWYPPYLAASVGSVNFSVARIVVLAVLAKALLTSAEGPSLSWGWVDTCVVGLVGGGCLAGAVTSEDMGSFLQYQAGSAFDTMLPYFAARLLIRRREDYLIILKSAAVVAAPLAVFGAYQCVSGDNPIGFLSRYSFIGATVSDRMLEARHGLWRGEATFGEPIMFGLFFAMVGPLCAGAWGYVRRKRLLVVGLVLMVVGMLSSMSSGPWLASVVACAVMALYPFRRHWRGFVVLLVVCLAGIDVASNRHWYDVLGDYLTLDSRTAWYRIRLMEVGLGGGMSGHWVAGFGINVDPGWGPLIDERGFTDVVNHYLVLLVRYGLLGLLPFLGMVGGTLAALRLGYRRARGFADRWLVWSLFSSLVGILAAMFSVSLMGQIAQVFFIVCALCVNAGQASVPLLTGEVP